jgi:hypothetical protein
MLDLLSSGRWMQGHLENIVCFKHLQLIATLRP